MHLSSITFCGLLIFNLQLSSTYPISPSLTETDVDIFKVLLQRLEAYIPEQTVVERADPAEMRSVEDLGVEDAADGYQAQGPDNGRARHFLSIKNLKTVNDDSFRKSSGCFGKRMDRIGSMSSFGCNIVGRSNPK